ncbi:MAG: hypothetical protein LBJ57_07935 [Prevotellaceae bacterium]|jgi:hypothetical protein|nr:hypothetical protein [Prevotellaceae bacterium]
MEQQTNTQTPKKDEIDALEIIILLYRKFKSLALGIIFILKAILIFSLRKVPHLSLCVMVGAIVGIAFYLLAPKIYRSEAIIRSNDLASSIVVDNIKKLSSSFRGEDKQDLSRLLNISESDTKKLHSLKVFYGLVSSTAGGNDLGLPAFYVNTDKIDTVSNVITKYIKIVADVLDEDVYPKLMPGLLHFLNSNAFGKELNTVRVELLKSQIAHVDRGIEILLQQQAVLATQKEKNNNISSLPFQLELNSQKNEVIQLQESIDGLHSRKMALEQELGIFSQPIIVVTDFSKSYTLAKKLSIYMILGAAAAFTLGLIVLALRENRKRIINALYDKNDEKP